MEENRFHTVATYDSYIYFGRKKLTENYKNDVKTISLQKNLIDLETINEYIEKFYEEKYKQHWDDNDKRLYSIDEYYELSDVFRKALNIAYDDIMLIVDNFDDFTFDMKMKVLFEVVDMTIRHEKKHNKNDKAREIIASLNSIQIDAHKTPLIGKSI